MELQDIMMWKFIVLLAIAAAIPPAVMGSQPQPKSALELLQAIKRGDAAAIESIEAPDLRRQLTGVMAMTLWSDLERRYGRSLDCQLKQTEETGDTVLVTPIHVVCGFNSGQVVFAVSMSTEGVAGLHIVRAQATSAQPAGNERLVEIGNPPFSLSGVLRSSSRREPSAIVVMVHGSGPMDRDSTVANTHLFRDLAESLSDLGVASLRYDKRTFQHALLMATNPDVSLHEETIEDARAALRLATEVVPKMNCVLLLGHSLGAFLAPAILDQSDVSLPSGLILLAAPGRKMADVMIDQVRFVRASSRDSSQNALLKNEEELLKGFQHKSKTDSSIYPGFWSRSAWAYFRSYDPIRAWQKKALPTLAVFGDKDYQVTSPDRLAWERLASQHESALSVVVMKDRSHVFTEVLGKPSPADYLQSKAADPALAVHIQQFARKVCPESSAGKADQTFPIERSTG